MMLPAMTASPPNFFTPRRLECESRPLRDEPPAFLCAICLTPLRREDASNPYERASRPFQVRCRCPDDDRADSLLLRQFLGLLTPVLDLVGAERHVGVDLLDIGIAERRDLGEGDDALLVEVLRRHRAD